MAAYNRYYSAEITNGSIALGIGIGVDRAAYRQAMQNALGADFIRVARLDDRRPGELRIERVGSATATACSVSCSR